VVEGGKEVANEGIKLGKQYGRQDSLWPLPTTSFLPIFEGKHDKGLLWHIYFYPL